jgi:D-alanyl-D-alanine carboxypeptidase (penicillin-binding protein 5/6)
MKRNWLIGLFCGLFLYMFVAVGFAVPQASAQVSSPEINAKAYYLMDYETGVVLAEEGSEEALPPASMTKILSAFVILDKIKEGKVKWDDRVKISERAAKIPETGIKLKAGARETVKTLFDAMLIYSANNATVALAEHVGGSEEDFVKLINGKLESLGLTGAKFRTASGLDEQSYGELMPEGEGNNIISAKDMAIVAKRLIETHPEVIDITKTPEKTLRRGTQEAEKIKNWNLMLPSLKLEYEGVDGLKTGFTDEAGYCFVGTMKKGNQRFISVVMGAETEEGRFHETKKLYDYASNFELKSFVGENQAVPNFETVEIFNSVDRYIPVVSQKGIKLPVQKDGTNKVTYQVTYYPNLQAPLKAGDAVGEVKVLNNGEEVKGMEPILLVTQSEVEEASSIRLFFRKIYDKVAGLLE